MPLYNANILSLTIQVVPHTSTNSSVVVPPASMRDLVWATIHFLVFYSIWNSLIPLYNANILSLTIQVVPCTDTNSLVVVPLASMGDLAQTAVHFFIYSI